jgi:hypothetical protein
MVELNNRSTVLRGGLEAFGNKYCSGGFQHGIDMRGFGSWKDTRSSSPECYASLRLREEGSGEAHRESDGWWRCLNEE